SEAPEPAELGDSGADPGASLADAAVVRSARGVVLPVLGARGDRLLVRTPCGEELDAAPSGLTPVSAEVVLDPGHGGDERGAVGPTGLEEKAVNLAVARAARAELAGAGVRAALTREADYRLTLDGRAAIVGALAPKAFVSIHHNAEPDGASTRPGAETYYQIRSAASKRLAGLIYEEALAAIAPHGSAWTADLDAGAKYRLNSRGGDYYAVLRQNAATPSALAELLFIVSPAEERLLRDPAFLAVEGAAVARGVLRFLRTKDPGSGFVEPYPRSAPAGPGGGRSGCVDPPL
ncbi:MAG: N-acetylmuramoyl-L-alanine amidase, partial [Acidimicrobiales bacterium]